MDTRPVQMTLPLSKMRTSHLRAGSLRVKESIKEAIKRALDGLDREEVARELSRLVGEEISVHTLNNWIAEGKSNRRFPLEVAKALVLITGDRCMLEAALEPEFGFMDEKGRAAYEYGLLMLENKDRRKRQKVLEEKAKDISERGFKYGRY